MEGSRFACTVTVEFEGNRLQGESEYFPTKKAAKDNACANFLKSHPELMMFKVEDDEKVNRDDFVSALNVCCQKNRWPMPQYTMTPVGMGFTCTVTVDIGLPKVLTESLFPTAFISKKLAKAAAASRMLDRIRAESSMGTTTEVEVDTYSKILEDDPEAVDMGITTSPITYHRTIESSHSAAVVPPPGLPLKDLSLAPERKWVGDSFSEFELPVSSSSEMNLMQHSPFISSLPIPKSMHFPVTSSEVSVVEVIEDHPMQKFRDWCAEHRVPEPILTQSQGSGSFRSNLKIKLNGFSYSVSSDPGLLSQDEADRSAARKAMTFIATQNRK